MRELKFRTWNPTYGISMVFTLQEVSTFLPKGGEKLLERTWPEETIFMQYTGLRDKNGKDIYEMDIVKCHDHPTGVDDGVGHVVFNWGYYSVSGRQSPLHDFGMAWTEVLGNIYENPELVSSYEIQI